MSFVTRHTTRHASGPNRSSYGDDARRRPGTTVSSTQAPGKVDVEKAEDVLHSLSRKRGVLRVKVAAKLHGTQQGLWHEDKHGGFLIGESSPYGVTSKLIDEVAEHDRLGDFHPNDPGRCFVVTTTDADVTAATMCDQWRNCQAPKNYEWLCDAELEFSNGQKVCEAFRNGTKLAVTFHKVQGRYLVVPALLGCGCDLTRDCRIVEDDDGWSRRGVLCRWRLRRRATVASMASSESAATPSPRHRRPSQARDLPFPRYGARLAEAITRNSPLSRKIT